MLRAVMLAHASLVAIIAGSPLPDVSIAAHLPTPVLQSLPAFDRVTWRHERPSSLPQPPQLLSVPTERPTTYPTRTATPSKSYPHDACVDVRDLQASQTRHNSRARATVPADLAYKCITGVPFNSSAAVAFLDSLRPYLNWQTTIQWLKEPPAEYAEKVQPPYDFFAEWERIYSQTQSGAYANEYSFGNDIYSLFQRAHDGHFIVYPDSFTQIFAWGRTTPLVSVSLDGESIPEVYVYQDILDSAKDKASRFQPSPVVAIDGQDSTEFLLKWSQYGSLQDQDALWNNIFYLLQQVSLGSDGTGTGTFTGGGRGRWIYPGPSTTLTFANGSSITNDNFARVLVPFDNITSAYDIYQQYFIPPSEYLGSAYQFATNTSSTMASTPNGNTNRHAPGYPTPIIRESHNLNSGYFLEGEGYDDVAVLSVASFVDYYRDEMPFQAINTYFLNEAVKQNKTKLIIDISANAGGTVLQGYDLFKQLFPSILPYGASRFRAHEANDIIGQEISAYSGLVKRSLKLNNTALSRVASPWNYRTDANVDYEPFTSWPDKFGPQTFGPQPDNYTAIVRWNLSDVLTPWNSGGITISGYGQRANITEQPFKAENIVVVTDGYCASTCTTFSELMRQQAGVKYVNLGGRPNKDITQAIGGVKGTNDYPYEYILYIVRTAFETHLLHSAEYYNTTALGDYNNLYYWRTMAAVVNARDGFRQNDPTNIPLQFQYEPADCRIYYTPAMAVDQTAAWKTVADAAFNGIDRCVAGSLSGGYGPGGYGRDLADSTASKILHDVSDNLDLTEHYKALSDVWTGKDGITPGGDGRMIV